MTDAVGSWSSGLLLGHVLQDHVCPLISRNPLFGADPSILTKSSKPSRVPLNSAVWSILGSRSCCCWFSTTFVALHEYPDRRANAAVNELERQELRRHVVIDRQNSGQCSSLMESSRLIPGRQTDHCSGLRHVRGVFTLREGPYAPKPYIWRSLSISTHSTSTDATANCCRNL